MGYLYTGSEGETLHKIIRELGNKDSYPVIMIRCLWELDGEEQDDLIGYCKYDDGYLYSLDGDDYSLQDRFIKWEEWVDEDEEIADNGAVCLTVWERGYSYEEAKELEKEWEKNGRK